MIDARADIGTSRGSHAGAKYFCTLIKPQLKDSPARARLLVAGCGQGHEALYLAQTLNVQVEAIDRWLDRGDPLPTAPTLRFQEANVCSLPFADAWFDFIFYHHVIEHVVDAPRSLRELSRVLKPGGQIFIGTPNRHRLISSVGAYGKSLHHKVLRNWHDLRMRCVGRFHNQMGAHAGFSRSELDSLLAVHFLERTWLTREYLAFKYCHGLVSVFVKMATCGCLVHIAAPSLYVLCRRQRVR